MSNILIVSPCFPPDKTVAVVRMASFVNYLISKGDRVIVMTNSKDLDQIESFEHVEFEFVDGILTGAGYKIFKHNEKQYCKHIERFIQDRNIDCALISMGPYYTIKMPKIIRNQGIKCILDFRDPWSFDFREETMVSFFKKLVAFPLKYFKEWSAIKNADYVTTVASGWLHIFKRLFFFERNKFFLVENGYDDVRLKNIEELAENNNNSDCYTIGVFGKLFYYTDKYSEIFLKAISRVNISDIQILQIGTKEEKSNQLLQKHNIPLDFIYNIGFADYAVGMKRLKRADCMLIIDARKHAIGTKVYDYIYLDKPIIYVGPKNSAIAMIIRDLPNCFCCDRIEEVSAAIVFLFENRDLRIGRSNSFSRTKQNEKMYDLLKK